MECNGFFENNIVMNNLDCVNWNQYYNNCMFNGLNLFYNIILFDNIGIVWIVIFQVRKFCKIF